MRVFACGAAFAAVVILASVFALTGCHKQDSAAQLTGAVYVDGGGLGGVTVEVFDAPSSSDSVWATTARHAAVGFRFTDQALFDYRFASTFLRTRRDSLTTGADGSFTFGEIGDGDYVVVAHKPGYGWSTPAHATMEGRSMDIGTLNLAPEIRVTAHSQITGDTHWLAGRHYVLEGALSIAPSAKLTIEPGAVVRVPERGRITVTGTLVCEGKADSMVIFTTDGDYPHDMYWNRVDVTSDADAIPIFRYCSFQFAESGIKSSRAGGSVENCFFSKIGGNCIDLTGVRATSSDSIVVRHNVIEGGAEGVHLVAISGMGTSVDHNAVFNCQNFGAWMDLVSGPRIYCNWFFNCGRPGTDSTAAWNYGAISLSAADHAEVFRNDIHLCWFGLPLGSLVDSTVQIHHNRFYGNTRAVNLGETPNRRGPTFPLFRDNCTVRNESWFIYNQTCSINSRTMYADSNYWGTISASEVHSRVFAPQDAIPPCPQILTEPILESCPDDQVGICEF